MSDQQIADTFADLAAKVKAYDYAERPDILQAINDAISGVLSKAGPSRPAPLDTQSAVPALTPTAASPAVGSSSTPSNRNDKMDPSQMPAAGSVTGSRPSTRVAAAPGGASSIVLGGVGPDHDTKAPVSARKYLQNSNQSSFSLSGEGGPMQSMSGVKIQRAPGGSSSIVFGDDSNPAPPDPNERKRGGSGSGRGQAATQAAAALAGSSPATPTNNEGEKANTSVKVAQAPGGRSNIMLGDDPSKAGVGSEDVPSALRKEISEAIYRKGKIKDTFTKFTGNKTKTLAAADFKFGLSTLSVNITDKQADLLVKEFAKDPAGMTMADFVRLLAV